MQLTRAVDAKTMKCQWLFS